VEKEAIEFLPERVANVIGCKVEDVENEKNRLYQQVDGLRVEVNFHKQHRSLAVAIAEKRCCIHPDQRAERQCDLTNLKPEDNK